jgi:large subunit ribosomal protein L13
MKTTTVKQPQQNYTVDAAGKPLGRLASEVSALLLAKNSVHFVKNETANVKVLVTNASHIKVTGDKMNSKTHKFFSMYPDGLRTPNFNMVVAKFGYARLVEHAVEGMLPKNKLQKLRMQNLTITE